MVALHETGTFERIRISIPVNGEGNVDVGEKFQPIGPSRIGDPC
jgi:hypothetical protein